MKTLKVSTKQQSYALYIGTGLLNNIGNMVLDVCSPQKVMIVTDDTVKNLYAYRVQKALENVGFIVEVFSIVPGENSKNTNSYVALLEEMACLKLSRSDVILALGGGVVGDLAGYAAATYLRGIKYFQVPTTFLSAIDSSVGGKTGINLNAGKNLAGAFWQPSGVYCDINTFDTLGDEIISDGVSELIKYGMIGEKSLFESITPSLFKNNVENYIYKCLSIKTALVELDESDNGNRQILNFGHTMGHAIEKASNYKITHGKAVAIGMVMVTYAAEQNGLCQDRLKPLMQKLKSFALPVDTNYSISELLQYVRSDKKIVGNNLTLVLPKPQEGCTLYKVSLDELENFLAVGGNKIECTNTTQSS